MEYLCGITEEDPAIGQVIQVSRKTSHKSLTVYHTLLHLLDYKKLSWLNKSIKTYVTRIETNTFNITIILTSEVQ